MILNVSRDNVQWGAEFEYTNNIHGLKVRDANFEQVLCSIFASLAKSNKIKPGWKIQVDNSCGGEIVTPIMTGGKDIEEVKTCFVAIHDLIKEADIDNIVGPDSGLHFHFDISKYDGSNVANIFLLMKQFEPIIYAMNPAKRLETMYCVPISVPLRRIVRADYTPFFDERDLRDFWFRPSNVVKNRGQPGNYTEEFYEDTSIIPGHYDSTRYHGLNLAAYWKFKTIEFRYPTSTFNILKFKAWWDIFSKVMIKAATTPTSQIMNDSILEKTVLINGRWDIINKSILHNIKDNLYRFAKMLNLLPSTVKFMIDRLVKFNERFESIFIDMNKEKSAIQKTLQGLKIPLASKSLRISGATIDDVTEILY